MTIAKIPRGRISLLLAASLIVFISFFALPYHYFGVMVAN